MIVKRQPSTDGGIRHVNTIDRTGTRTGTNHNQIDAILTEIRTAQNMLKQDRQRGLARLNDIFRAGQPPEPPLAGSYTGELVALNIAPGLTQLFESLLATWLPWQGKTFDPGRARGDNIFSRDSRVLARIYWPLYRNYVDDGNDTYRAFAFRTYIASGKSDPDRQVLKIDYGLRENPRLTIRRVLDELVQIADGLYLGQAHLQWWWGRWQMVAYFLLRSAKYGNE